MYDKSMLRKAQYEKQDNKVFVLKLSSEYVNNCSEQEFTEVSEDVLQVYSYFNKSEERHRDWCRTHENKFVTTEAAMEQNEKQSYEFDEIQALNKVLFESLKNKCGRRTYIRTMYHFLYNMEISEIAAMEKVSINAVMNSINKAVEILSKTYKIERN